MHRAAWSGAFLVLAMISTGCANNGGDACEGDAPMATYLCCDDGWVDPINDAANCGSCGYTCASGQYCRIGRCEGTVVGDGGTPTGDGGGNPGLCSPMCSSSQRCCGTACVGRTGVAIGADGRTDPTFSNCTACGAACDPDRASACSVPGGGTGAPRCMCGVYDACGAGQMCARSGTDFACVSLSTDPNNCGAIGNVCGANEDCIAGVCTPRMCGSVVCAETEACCGAACVDTQTDAANCGGCGMACSGDESCQAGVCVCGSGAEARECEAPMAGMFGAPGNLGESCCDGTCIANTDTNCGCGVTCNAEDDETCQVGGSLFPGGSTEAEVCCGDESVGFFGCGGSGGSDGGIPCIPGITC